MSQLTSLSHRFVESFPDTLEPGIVYISVEFASVSHLCCCGCGAEVITPLTPKDWKMTFDGETISLNPSIGSWSLPCRSHYFIRQNQVQWAGPWSNEQIRLGRERDLRSKRGTIETKSQSERASSHNKTHKKAKRLFERLFGWFRR